MHQLSRYPKHTVIGKLSMISKYPSHFPTQHDIHVVKSPNDACSIDFRTLYPMAQRPNAAKG
jgi:hypothetical protein